MWMNTPSIKEKRRTMAIWLRDHWMLFMGEGILLVILGLAAIIIPTMATLAIEILVGWVFLISGIAGLTTTFWMRNVPGFLWSLISAILGIAAGIMLLLWPLSGIFSLTLVLILFFVIEGIASIMFTLEHRREQSGRLGWMLWSGMIDLFMAAIIFTGLPGTAIWALGLLVGINMIFGGSALIAMAMHAHRGSSRSVLLAN